MGLGLGDGDINGWEFADDGDGRLAESSEVARIGVDVVPWMIEGGLYVGGRVTGVEYSIWEMKLEELEGGLWFGDDETGDIESWLRWPEVKGNDGHPLIFDF